ncbi:fungal-specific transcription factor domain-containing protein [Aspergillus multicolor]|uniref:transcription factor domain-containing protein n=1 Tax=Aspergillus multicolor TaxID=41759 RepID=UPI003CCCECDD
MSASEKSKRPPRKHVTTACVPCRESKIRCDGASPHCKNCERKKRQCKYQHGDDKRKVSLRAATELFSARIDQLIQFIYDHGLEPPSMKPEDEAGINRVLDTLQIPRGVQKRKDSPSSEGLNAHTQSSPPSQPPQSPLPIPLYNGNTATSANSDSAGLPSQNNLPTSHSTSSGANSQDSFSPFGFHFPSTNWEFALPTAESLDSLYANLNGGYQASPENGTSCSPDSLQLSQDIAQQPGVLLEQAQALNTKYEDNDSDSGEEDEAEKDVIEQISHRIGTLKIAGDGHLRFFGATSNLNLVDVSATQQRQRPDARTVRHDGQDILNHLRVGQPVDHALEDHLLELYFTWQNTSTYVVDKEMYYTARQKWREEFDDTPFYSEVLTNAMCSIGSAFEARYHSTFITFPKSLSEFFSDRAKALLEIELDSPCVATVQALVILSCHEGASNRDARGWLYSGMSMRLAFDLGLHLDMTPYVERGDMSAFEADVRRIAFWGSYVADHFWGFYLGRPFRMNAGDITVPKPASDLTVGKEGTWRPYGLPANANQEAFSGALKNPNELISRQFAVLWEIISPLGHVLYGCSDIPRHELQRYSSRITDDLFAWKANLPSILDIDLADDTTPRLPHLLMLQYPTIPPNRYHHARKMCIESSIAIARLLRIYEKHYTFRRMNNQVVSMIFSAALILLYVTISTTPLASRTGLETLEGNRSEMTAYLNLCFRALDELGQSFENAKRTRDFLVSLQRRWQARMRRSGALKRAQSSQRLPVGSKMDAGGNKGSTMHGESTRKKSRTSISTQPQAHAHTSSLFSLASSPPHTHAHQHQTAGAGAGTGQAPSATSTFLPSLDPKPVNVDGRNQNQSHAQPNDIDTWIRDSDLGILPDNITDTTTAAASAFRMSGANPNPNPTGEVDDVEIGLPSLVDIEPWWDPRIEGTSHADGHETGDVAGTSAYRGEL